MPAAARLTTECDTESLSKLLYASLRTVSLLSMPLFWALAVFATPILHVWVGTVFPETVMAIRLLSAAFFLATVATVIWYFLIGSGMVAGAVGSALLETGVGVVASFALVKHYGIAGIGGAAIVSAMVSLPLYFGLIWKRVDLPLGSSVYKIFIAPLLVCATAAFLCDGFLAKSLGSCGVFLAACYLGFWSTGVVGRHERIAVRRWMAEKLSFSSPGLTT
jgi:O-antigen/teichoic acid export membrane protein